MLMRLVTSSASQPAAVEAGAQPVDAAGHVHRRAGHRHSSSLTTAATASG